MVSNRSQGSATLTTFVEALRREHRMSAKEANRVMKTVYSTIEDSLKENRSVIFPRIGTIQVEQHDERLSVNPKTGQKILLNKRRGVKFVVSPAIITALNEDSGNPRTFRLLSDEEAQKYTKKRKKKKD